MDCEMVEVSGRRSELVRLCAVDYLSGEILINTLVTPTKRVMDWRTKYSGVTRSMLVEAAARGQVLNGWESARAELWKYINSETILIGQSLHHDIDVLRMVHTGVVDSAILTKNAVHPNCRRAWGLKTLCDALLGIEIQNQPSGHDCLEDAFAAREIVLWCIQNPDKLMTWAESQRKSMRNNEGNRPVNCNEKRDDSGRNNPRKAED
jgi:DNA polymerase III epsilon subunit-like protein